TSVPQTPTATASTSTDPPRGSGAGMSSRWAVSGLCGSTVMAFTWAHFLSSLRHVGACHVRRDRIQPGACRNEQRLSALTAEADVRGPPLVGDQDSLNLPAGLIEDSDALTCEVEIAFVVQGHTVRALIDCERLACDAAIRRDVVPVGPPCADIRHVERLAVGRADDAVWLYQVIDHAYELPAIGGQEVDVLAVLRHRVVRPPRPLVERIGEV